MFRRPGAGRSKASADTLCQKCLQRGHYSYECKAPAQERPYKSRPSRTQQLLNPQLKPKLNTHVPDDLLRKRGLADQILATHALLIDAASRTNLLVQVEQAATDALWRLKRNAEGDYTPDPNELRFPEWEPPEFAVYDRREADWNALISRWEQEHAQRS